MSYKLIDSHCHLQAAAYGDDRADVLSRLEENGCGAVAVGTNFLTSKLAVELARMHGNVWAAIAVHPGHTHCPHHDESELAEAPEEEHFDARRFSELASDPKVVAIGETGLDFYRLPEEGKERALVVQKQKDDFVEHIRFARERGLPLIMHIRDAQDDAWEILKAEKHFKGAMHSFTGTVTQAERFLAAGYYLSFTGAITYPPKKGQEENPLLAPLRMTPIDRLLIETDAPWLAPVPLRGKRNEPSNIRIVAEKAAEIRGVSFEEIAEATAGNAVRLFSLA